MKAYVMKITEPMQIPAVVYETRERTAIEPLVVFLEHCEEPNIVRGRSQPLEKPHITEIKRPDGGLSWYHPGTYCMMRGRMKHEESVAASQEDWGHALRILLASFGYPREKLSYRDSDVYFTNGHEKHLVGLSGWRPKASGNIVEVQRACWYERNPLPDIAHLLEADGIAPEHFEAKLETVHAGFFDMLLNESRAEAINVTDFISIDSTYQALELQKKKEGGLRGACVMGRQNI